MARGQRMKSVSGIYHIMMRGNNKQQVFFDAEDYHKFLSVLGICKGICGFKIYAYCLMENHVHLLIQEGEEPLDKVFKRIGVRFVGWFNTKYKRCGNLFQGRFKSIPVNDDEYFITVLRYIHQNPVKAGIAKKCSDYDFSSYNAYFSSAPLVDTDFAMSLMSVSQFKELHNEPVKDSRLEKLEQDTIRLTLEEAAKAFEECTHCKNQKEFQSMPKDMQGAYINVLKKQHLSIRQISNLTGVSIYNVRK
ncbi:MAG: transposase [Eubacterium sp.]|nr:transposase [Eubacterium sp.]